MERQVRRVERSRGLERFPQLREKAYGGHEVRPAAARAEQFVKKNHRDRIADIAVPASDGEVVGHSLRGNFRKKQWGGFPTKELFHELHYFVWVLRGVFPIFFLRLLVFFFDLSLRKSGDTETMFRWGDWADATDH